MTEQRLKKMLEYDSATGIFTAKSRRQGLRKKIGTVNSDGYLVIMIDYKNYYAHRLAWLYVYGEFPEKQIDHLNHNKLDNCIGNLANADHCSNAKNRPLQSNNKTGYHGISETKRGYRARIMVNQVEIPLYHGKSEAKAIAARKEAEIKYGFHANHGKDLT